MEATIKRIIEIEQSAQNVVQEGIEEKERIRQAMLDESQQLEAQIGELADNKIAKLLASNTRDTHDRVIRIYEDTALKMRLMEENAEENQKKWEDQIFESIVGR